MSTSIAPGVDDLTCFLASYFYNPNTKIKILTVPYTCLSTFL